MPNKKKKKLKKPIRLFGLFVFCAVLIAFTVYFALSANREIRTTFSLRADLKIYEEQLKALEAERDSLVNQKEKLTDENYVSNVARGKYLFSKDNEQIYYFPPLED
ncbi:MAG: septum formation initiator family protein [Erysipelotrichaceae bacterium]|nr:septum formation initiator family protein [Erysipelotrichaceae bacterium]MBR5048358.1 septum formation initiator family protein [Erysipelotrichaceae bacterium]